MRTDVAIMHTTLAAIETRAAGGCVHEPCGPFEGSRALPRAGILLALRVVTLGESKTPAVWVTRLELRLNDAFVPSCYPDRASVDAFALVAQTNERREYRMAFDHNGNGGSNLQNVVQADLRLETDRAGVVLVEMIWAAALMR